MKRQFASFDRAAGQINRVLIVLAFGLACLDLTIFLALHAPAAQTNSGDLPLVFAGT